MNDTAQKLDALAQKLYLADGHTTPWDARFVPKATAAETALVKCFATNIDRRRDCTWQELVSDRKENDLAQNSEAPAIPRGDGAPQSSPSQTRRPASVERRLSQIETYFGRIANEVAAVNGGSGNREVEHNQRTRGSEPKGLQVGVKRRALRRGRHLLDASVGCAELGGEFDEIDRALNADPVERDAACVHTHHERAVASLDRHTDLYDRPQAEATENGRSARVEPSLVPAKVQPR